MAISAQFFDGSTPTAHTVSVEGVHEGLRIFWADGEVVWPWKEIRQVDGARGEAKLTWKNGDARLMLPQDEWRALKNGRLRDGGGDHRTTLGREAKIGGGLLIAAIVLFGSIYFGMPAASGAIAAMMPLGVERRMGESVTAQAELVVPPCKGERAERGNEILTALGQRLGKEAKSPFPITVRIVDAPFPNAFALPGGTVMVTSDLIAEAEHPDEVAGVLSHEVAHVAERHVAKGFIRSMTIGAVVDLLIGGGGAAAPIASTAVSTSTLRYDRADEADADKKGAEYLQAAGLDPGALARFFERVVKIEGTAKKNGFEVPELLSTHPDSAKRAALARKMARPGSPPALSPADWTAVKAACPVNARPRTPSASSND